MSNAPLVTDIARGSFVDGPGIRTVVFFKGCPLRCVWCHNPETQAAAPEVMFYPDNCIRCGECAKRCPRGAVDLRLPYIIDRDRCHGSGACAEACNFFGLEKTGTPYLVESLAKIILRDATYYKTSGGGVTFTGGEPLMHMDYLASLARRLSENGIHIAIETCGHFNYFDFKKKLLPWVNLILFDIKLMDPDLHRKYTGKDNRIILRNLRRLMGEERIDLLPRIPLIPDYTTGKENLRRIVCFFKELEIRSWDFLTYNPSGINKYRNLGKVPPSGLPEKPFPLEEEMLLKDMFLRRMLER